MDGQSSGQGKIMRIPDLNIVLDLDHDVPSGSGAGLIRVNPVIQIVERDHERISANPASCRGMLIAVWHEVGRSILRRRIADDIGRNGGYVADSSRVPAST